ncbi:BgTH12-00008 [Blumeria graminis f. sp. triticale]|uniref:BgTH12-00008 n=1 Tax=Blumeria graminis f. sp. triticale TaxID=1689686 RepID=A0A9W4D557_BLUGR|nr:BgTH12-00008 [Blumeria graminis f. sp. triticale]
MKIVLSHLAIALLRVFTPALALTFDCSGVKIHESEVTRQKQEWDRNPNPPRDTLSDGTSNRYSYFEISTSLPFYQIGTYYRCYIDTGMPQPDVREWDGSTWKPCTRESKD